MEKSNQIGRFPALFPLRVLDPRLIPLWMIHFFAFMNPAFRELWLSLWSREVGWGIDAVTLVLAEVLLRKYPVVLEWSGWLLNFFRSLFEGGLPAWRLKSLYWLIFVLGIYFVPVGIIDDWHQAHLAVAFTVGLGILLWLLMSSVDSLQKQTSDSPFLGALGLLGGLLAIGLLAIRLTSG